jgi:hypothetical protein
MKDGILGTLDWQRPESSQSPPGFALTDADPFTVAIDRFGLPVVPAPFDQTSRSQALYLLQAAAELEHSLLIQYLYAAYSIDTNTFPDLQTWQDQLVNIAIQEMDHLLCVQNLLMALKADHLYFDRANFPIPPAKMRPYPFPFRLEPLSITSLAEYVTAESPYPLPEDLPSGTTPSANFLPHRGSTARTWKRSSRRPSRPRRTRAPSCPSAMSGPCT